MDDPSGLEGSLSVNFARENYDDRRVLMGFVPLLSNIIDTIIIGPGSAV